MYFFSANLSSVDLCFSSVTVSKALVNHMVGSKSISYTECMAQMYLMFTFSNMDSFLLSMMAYDRYVAILPHFFCDPYPILKLSRSDTFINDLMVFTVGGVIFLTPFSFVVSYAYIFSNVLKMPSTHGIKKVLPTCGSHLPVVSLFYGAMLGVYMRPSSSYSLQDMVIAVIFTVVTPLVNTFIYSLKNWHMKRALRR
ncbi:hypothetical protein U0070_017407 [Myodes glareolus]|uniref:G-protein coupled receptors family 1 profile domain-containing protein n=1 Tax=Myodes glareolus TaxID=447135 RepID=A0AAW0H7L2_MYOGA